MPARRLNFVKIAQDHVKYILIHFGNRSTGISHFFIANVESKLLLILNVSISEAPQLQAIEAGSGKFGLYKK